MAILKSSDYRMQAVNILLRINQDKLKHVHQPFGQLEYVFVSKKEELVLCKYSLIFFWLHVPQFIILLTLVLST